MAYFEAKRAKVSLAGLSAPHPVGRTFFWNVTFPPDLISELLPDCDFSRWSLDKEVRWENLLRRHGGAS